jgi:hypothetical protein
MRCVVKDMGRDLWLTRTTAGYWVWTDCRERATVFESLEEAVSVANAVGAPLVDIEPL